MRATWLCVVLLISGCTAGSPGPHPSRSTVDLLGTPRPIATNAGPFSAGPVEPPATGALVGAWVQPERFNEPSRIAAVTGFEAGIGRPLDIVNSYRRFDEEFGTESDRVFLERGMTLMLSWASGDTRSIVLGQHDDLIRARARELRDLDVPVLLRFRWEMDRPNLRATMWSPEDFVAAWRYVRQIFAEEGATNASWVWCPTAEGFEGGYASAFYPGDDAVDWVCVDVYASSRLASLDQLMAPFLRWAAQRGKPIIVGEYGVARAYGGARRAAWLRDAGRVFRANPQIKAVSYFESNPDENGPYQQFRIADDAPALRAMREVTQDSHFVRPAR